MKGNDFFCFLCEKTLAPAQIAAHLKSQDHEERIRRAEEESEASFLQGDQEDATPKAGAKETAEKTNGN